MEDDKINIEYEKKEYIFRIIYLIRINLPSSEYVYLFMFFFKSIGHLLISTSLNDWTYQEYKSDEINNAQNHNSTSLYSSNFTNFINTFFSNLLINGNNLRNINKYYQELCIFGFFILFIYISFVIFGFIYMRNKYFNNTIISFIEKKMKIINKSSNFEKALFKIISYFFFFISFFHQYIIEYYSFGFMGYIFYLFGVFNSNSFYNRNDAYSSSIKEHFKNISINPIIFLVINIIVIILVLIIFILFMILNSTKTLFINNGYSIYGNKIYLIIKLIIYNFNPLYGLINIFSAEMRIKITIIIMIILIAIFLIEIIIYFYKFCFYPNILSYLCIFFEIFSLFSIISELIIYLTDSKINSLKFFMIKISFEFINSFIFTFLLIQNKNKNNLKQFSNKLFNKAFKNLNPDDIYFYIKKYIKYSKNKENNYINIFRLIQYHILSCDKRDCPCKNLIPKNMLYSRLTNFNINKDEENQNINEEKATNNININANIFVSEPSFIKKSNQNLIDAKSFQNIKQSTKNLRFLMAEEENSNLDMRKRSYSVRKTMKFSDKKKQIYISKESKEKKDSNIINESNIKINHSTNSSNFTTIKKDIKQSIVQKNKLTDEELKMIGEQEIINRINYLYEIKNYEILEDYIFIHLQYLIRIKSNYRIALYYVSKYSNYGIKLGFLSRYFLYEIKKYICKNIINSKNFKKIEDPYIIKYNKENLSMKKLIKYLTLYHIIKKLLKISCQNIIFFFSFRVDLHSTLTLQKYIKTKIHPVIESAEEIQLSINKLKFLIEKYYNEEKVPIESIELSYLICNFFKIIEGKLSQDILKFITPIINFRVLYYEKLVNEFHHFMMSNPLIISINIKDTFIISYFTNYFLEKLGYSYLELKNQDFHEKLFPGPPDLIKEHTFMMKQFLFFYENEFSKDNTFIKSKEGYLVSINFTCKIFPNFQDNFYLIVNIIFNDDLLPEFYSHINNKKTNNFNISNDKINTYSFLLDYDFDFFGLTKNFFTEYDLNENMFRELRINFCQFFCIDENKLIEKIIKERRNLIKKNPKFNQKISLRESNKAYTIFQNVKIENLFKIRDENFLESYFFPSIFIYEKIDKKRLIRKIPEILNIIDEIGLDYDWYVRILNFKERIIINSRVGNNIKDTGISELGHHQKYKIEEDNPSIINERINLESNFIKFPEQFFEMVISIKKLGSISYYIVNLLEKINDNFETTKFMNENGETNNSKILEKNTVNKKFKKLISKKNIKINSLLSSSASAKTMKGNMGKEDVETIKRNAKTKVFFQVPSSSTLKNNNKNFAREQTIIENPNNKELPQKLENNLDDNNITNKNEDNKSMAEPKKNSINLDKLDLNKFNNLKIKDSFEEEEIVPLISKEKFNVTLKNYKKSIKILILFIFIIIIIEIVIIITKFIICMLGFSLSATVLKTTIYLEMIKVDIYEQAILSLLYCINESYNWTKLSLIHSEAESKNTIILEHLKILQDNVNSIFNNKFCNGITNILKEKFFVYHLNLDWTISEVEVDILQEIRQLSYKAFGLVYTNDICQINTFYDFIQIGPSIIKQKELNQANNMQQILFYFLNNILKRYKSSFDKLSEESAISIQKIFFNYQNTLFYLLIILIILLLIFIILYCIKSIWDTSYYHLLFMYYYNIENEQLKFGNQIYYLYKTILEFTYKNINYFENMKNNSYMKNCYDNNILGFSNLIKNNNINDIKSINTKIPSSKRNKKGNNQEDEKNKQNNINLDGSMNGSSAQFLNNSNNHKLNLGNNLEKNNNFLIPSFNEKDPKDLSQEDSVDSLLKMSKKIIPKASNISVIVIIIGIFLYLFLAIINIAELNNQKLKWKYSINLSMNILERIPKLMEMLVYACITVMSNNQNIMKASSNDNQPKYLTFFKVNSLYYSDDIMNKYFKNTFFGELLRDNYRINYNFNNYLSQEKNNIFINTKYWENLLNTGGYFCLYATIGEKVFTNEGKNIYDLFKKVEYDALNCIEENPGINESGAKLEINYISQELVNKFIEFITHNNSNISLNQARSNFFDSKDIKNIFNDMRHPIILYYNTINFVVFQDFQVQIGSLIKTQILYDLFLFFIILSITICLLFFNIKYEKYKKLFAYFSTMPKTNNSYS